MPRWPNGKSSPKENLLSPRKPVYNPIPPPLAASPRTPPSNSAASPKRGRGRPAGSFKFKPPPPKPVVLVNGKPRGPGRPVGSIKKQPKAHQTRDTNRRSTHHASDTNRRSTQHASDTNRRSTQHASDTNRRSTQHAAETFAQILNPSVERAQRETSQGVQPSQAVSCTHDFSILSRAEMHRLAAASAAAAILKFSEDPRFASHAAVLESSARELDRRAREGYDAA
jgi:hypothetical protein